MTDVRNIAVVRALGGLGDVLCAVPALRNLRRSYPDARISYFGLAAVKPVVERYASLVDRFVEFPGFPGIVEQPFDRLRLHEFLGELRITPRFDLAVQMHGSGSVSNAFTALLGARRMAGYHLPNLWCPDLDSFFTYPVDCTELERWTRLTQLMGLADTGTAIDFPVDDTDRRAVACIGVTGRYAVIHAGASDARRRWSPASFAAVGDRLAERGLQVVLTGVRFETGIVDQVAANMTSPALTLCGRTTLGSAAALIEGAQLVVTNDTGTSHIAAATRTPSVTIFLISDPVRWAPLDGERHRIAGTGIPDAIAGIEQQRVEPRAPSVEDVMAEVDHLMAHAA